MRVRETFCNIALFEVPKTFDINQTDSVGEVIAQLLNHMHWTLFDVYEQDRPNLPLMLFFSELFLGSEALLLFDYLR